MKITERNGLFYDEKNNFWKTKEEAKLFAPTLKNCSYCNNCTGCSYCSDWKAKPESISSPAIGSRQEKTIIFFDEKRTEVVCGCFRGTLDEFKERVKKTHGNNQHGKDYMAWIARVEKYMKG